MICIEFAERLAKAQIHKYEIYKYRKIIHKYQNKKDKPKNYYFEIRKYKSKKLQIQQIDVLS